MGILYSVRGWLELTPEQLEAVERIISVNQDQNPYLESWALPKRGGGFSRFVFFGHTVNEASLDRIRSQIERIATTIQTKDGHITDYVACRISSWGAGRQDWIGEQRIEASRLRDSGESRNLRFDKFHKWLFGRGTTTYPTLH